MGKSYQKIQVPLQDRVDLWSSFPEESQTAPMITRSLFPLLPALFSWEEEPSLKIATENGCSTTASSASIHLAAPGCDVLSVEPMTVPYLQSPPSLIPIDVGRQLFVDDFLIEKTDLERTFTRRRSIQGIVLVASTREN